jgi:hypothetical protein
MPRTKKIQPSKPTTRKQRAKAVAKVTKERITESLPITIDEAITNSLDGNAPRKRSTPKPQKSKKSSGLDIAAQILKASEQPMRCRDIVQRMIDDGLWQTNGKTPPATIYAAMIREIQTKGEQSRFKKTDRGLFTHNG